MKGELTSIRPELEKLGPIGVPPEIEVGENENDPLKENDETTFAGVDNDAVTHNSADDKDNDISTQQQKEEPTGIPVFHVNANKFPQVGARNKIHGLPTLVLFYEGVELWRHEGVLLGGEIVEQLMSLQEEGCWERAKEQGGSSLVLDEN